MPSKLRRIEEDGEDGGGGRGVYSVSSIATDIAQARHKRKPFDPKYLSLALSSVDEAIESEGEEQSNLMVQVTKLNTNIRLRVELVSAMQKSLLKEVDAAVRSQRTDSKRKHIRELEPQKAKRCHRCSPTPILACNHDENEDISEEMEILQSLQRPHMEGTICLGFEVEKECVGRGTKAEISMTVDEDNVDDSSWMDSLEEGQEESGEEEEEDTHETEIDYQQLLNEFSTPITEEMSQFVKDLDTLVLTGKERGSEERTPPPSTVNNEAGYEIDVEPEPPSQPPDLSPKPSRTKRTRTERQEQRQERRRNHRRPEATEHRDPWIDLRQPLSIQFQSTKKTRTFRLAHPHRNLLPPFSPVTPRTDLASLLYPTIPTPASDPELFRHMLTTSQESLETTNNEFGFVEDEYAAMNPTYETEEPFEPEDPFVSTWDEEAGYEPGNPQDSPAKHDEHHNLFSFLLRSRAVTRRRHFSIEECARYMAEHIARGRFRLFRDMRSKFQVPEPEEMDEGEQRPVLTSHRTFVALLHLAHHHNNKTPKYEASTALLGEKKIALVEDATTNDVRIDLDGLKI